MSVALSPHRRQFILGPTPWRPNNVWQQCAVGSAGWLSYCPALPVVQATDANSEPWYLLGLAIETRPQKSSPLTSITQTTTESIPHLYTHWAGRWLLLGAGQVHLDASGLLGCCYGRDQAGRIWASSSARLLADVLKTSEMDSRDLFYEMGISWYTPPRTRVLAAQKLLPSQVLTLPEGCVTPRPLMPAIQPENDYAEALNHIQTHLVTTLNRLPDMGTPIWLGLTAGYDSRLMLALSQLANIKVQPFTRVTARMSVADRRLPPKLAQICGYPHCFFHRGQRFPERQALVTEHSGGQVSMGDAEPFIRGDRDQLNGLTFGGHGFALSSGFYKLRDLPQTLSDPTVGAQQIARLFQEPLTSSATAGLQAWLSWVLTHPQAHLDWRDRFFLEQRQAGWLSAKEQVYDLLPVERFPILNCAALNAKLLSIPESQRTGSRLQADLIQRVTPELLQYPFNPDDFYFGLAGIVQAKAANLPAYLYGKMKGKLRSLGRNRST